MAGSPSEAVVFGTLAVLNIGVAYVVLHAKPVRIPHVLVAILVGGNGLWALKVTIGHVVGFGDSWIVPLDLALNAPVFAAFAILPFFFPRRRFHRTGRRVVIGVAAAYVLLNWALLATGALSRNTVHEPLSMLVQFAPFFAGLALGTILLVDTYVTTPSDAERNQTRFLLAAYVLKLGTYALTVYVAWSDDVPHYDFELQGNVLFLPFLLLAFPLAFAAYAIVAARFREGASGTARPSASGDAFLLACVVLSPAFATNGLNELEYMVLRPLLLAYGLLEYQFLDVELRARRAGLVTMILAALAGTFLIVLRALE